MLWTELGRRRHAGVVGRLREREHDLAAVGELLGHHGGVLLIEGQAGIGKTSLVEAACSRAEELGHEVVHARGSELESGFAFGVVRQLFERRLAALGEGERAVLLAGDIAPTSRPVAVNYIHVLRYRDGKHTLFNLLFDRLEMLEQLGLLPAPAPAG